MSKNNVIAIFAICGILLLPGMLTASQVFRCPRPDDSFGNRVNWAQEVTSGPEGSKGYWIGYSIPKMMWESAYYAPNGMYMLSDSSPSFRFLGKTPLGALLYGGDFETESPQKGTIQEAAKAALDHASGVRKPRKKVLKDVAILLRFQPGVKISGCPDKISFCNLAVPFDPGDKPVFWLEQAEDEEGFEWIKGFYSRAGNEKVKKSILSAAGFHSRAEGVKPFMSRILTGRESDPIRGRAASELGDLEDETVVPLLHKTAKTDRSSYVRKRAVYALEDVDFPSAVDAVIDLARTSDDKEVRKAAISTLGDIASQKAASVLDEMVYSDEDSDIQKRAVYALEDLPGGSGIPYLIKIAKTHASVKVRKSAIYSLGDSDDPRAREALIEIIQNDNR